MITNISIAAFFNLDSGIPLIDVRTPAEFEHGQIPGALNLPLFSNEERIQVGITYKKKGREEAILLGFDLVGKKWSGFIKKALAIAPNKKVGLHCWRGGMRSGAMAWTLSFYGFDVYLINGGYKSYRKWVRQFFDQNYQFCVLGGMTGSGKTKILNELAHLGEQVIDLEFLAQHQGSSYGSKNKLIQPSQEQFENNLAESLKDIKTQKIVWIEDESNTIGRCAIPIPFWRQMQAAILIELQVELEKRIRFLTLEYGILDKDFLVESTIRIRKRLGFDNAKLAVEAIRENRMEDFIRLLLFYYDKTYKNCISKRNQQLVFLIKILNEDLIENARQILLYVQNLKFPKRKTNS